MEDKGKVLATLEGSRVKTVRKYYGYSRKEFAKEISKGNSYAQNYIYEIETGRKGLSKAVAEGICSRFPDVRMGFLFGELEYMTAAQEHAQKISDAVDEMSFQGQFDQTMEDAARMIILSVLRKESLSFGPDQETTFRLENTDPRIDGDSILYEDYAHREKDMHDLSTFRISGDWINSFSEELASYGEYLFRRKMLNHEKEFEEVADDSQR